MQTSDVALLGVKTDRQGQFSTQGVMLLLPTSRTVLFARDDTDAGKAMQ